MFVEKEWLKEYENLPEDAKLGFVWLVNHFEDMKILVGGTKQDAERVMQICRRLMDEEAYVPAALAALKYAMLKEEGA